MTEKHFRTEGAAKAFLTRWEKGKTYSCNFDGPLDRSKFAIADEWVFRKKIEKQVVRKNLMTGKEYTERLNEPSCTSPASETYWCM
tara:strand:+ start:354 stop:611 length:258 start_codon:yes stop_codon:yes gene_type:complete